ncbi:MAG: DinB family protein [Thermomicrobiales bacterium]
MAHEAVIGNARKTDAILRAMLNGVDQTAATTSRDGADGWTVLEVVCHLRDFELLWQERVGLAIRNDAPAYEPFDVLGLVTRNDYINQNFELVLAERQALRADSLALIATLDDTTINRFGIHPTRGEMSILAQAQQLTTHDVDHIEQIARILGKVS